MQNQLPILIAGGGPVGLSLALALGRKNIPVEVFEADIELNSEIRASTFHPPTLEMLDEWGVVGEFMAGGHKVGNLQYWERNPRKIVADFDYSRIEEDTPFPFRLQLPQHLATRILMPAVERTPSAQVHMGHRLLEFTDFGTHVTAIFDTPNGLVTRDGMYLCGADGTRSTTRNLLHMGFKGMTYEDRFLLAGTDLRVSDLLPGAGPVCYIFDPDEWVIILNLPDIVRIVFRMQDHEDEQVASSQKALRERIGSFFGTTPGYEILTTQLYHVHQRVADSFVTGRVILLGDAAHINNPAGGMGMNSGIHDAHSLAMTFENAIMQDTDAAIQAWATNRRNTALDAVQSYTDKQYKNMVLKNPAARQKRNAELKALAADPVTEREYLLRASMLSERV